MRASTDQYGDFRVAGASDQIDHTRGLVIYIKEGVHIDRGSFPSRSRDTS